MRPLKKVDKTHKTRTMLHHYITKHPGATTGSLSKIFQTPLGTIKYHLDVLEKEGMIEHRLEKRRRRYYGIGPAGGLTDDQKRLIYIIRTNPGIGQKEITRRVGQKRHVVKYNLKKLCECDVIHVEKRGRRSIYYHMSSADLKYNREHVKLISRFLHKEIDLDSYMDLKKLLDTKYDR